MDNGSAPPQRRQLRRGRVWLVHLGAVLLILLVTIGLTSRPAAAALKGNPFRDGPWWVDPDWNPALDAERAMLAAGNSQDAKLLSVIANTTQARWIPWMEGEQSVSDYLDRVARESGGSTVPVLVTENLPGMGCADNPGGAPTSAAFSEWVSSFARGIGSHRAIVVVESDGVASSSCLHGSRLRARIGLIAHEVLQLAVLPNTAVYIDAGASDWAPANRAATLLRWAGIAHARGFALNTTHYDWTRANVRYGRSVLHYLRDNKHFVVNTALNGRGPLQGRRYHVWCNPEGRALGPLPTIHTGDSRADAFYWLGTPGTSDGACGNDRGSMLGPPIVGTFWLQWALELSENALHARDFPAYRR